LCRCNSEILRNAAAKVCRVSRSNSRKGRIPANICSPLDETIIVECKGGFKIHFHRKILVENSQFFASELSRCKRSGTSGVIILRTNLPRRFSRRYALWLYGSRDYATLDPSLTAPEFLLELRDLHIAAGMLQDKEFANRVMNAMILHLIQRSDKVPLKDFLSTFLQTNMKGSAGRKLMADWIVWSAGELDVRSMSNLQQLQDAHFFYAVARAGLRKTRKEWEGDLMPPYVLSLCLYHTHLNVGRSGCNVLKETEMKSELDT
jgi:hypothetical protein